MEEEEEKEQQIYPQERKEEVLVIKEAEAETEEFEREKYSKITLKLKAPPVGQISTIVKIVNYLRDKFEQCTVEIAIRASEGKIQIAEYENKVMEALEQDGFEIVEEYKK